MWLARCDPATSLVKYSGELCCHSINGQTADDDPFVAGFLATHDRDVAAWTIEQGGEERDQRVVCSPIDGRRSNANEKRVTAYSRDAGVAGTRNDANSEGNSGT